MTTFEDPGSPDMGLKQLVVGKSKKAGGTLGWVGSTQVFEVGGDVWVESRVHQRIFLVADETDVCLVKLSLNEIWMATGTFP